MEPQLPPLGTPPHPQHRQHGGLCPGRVRLCFLCTSQVCSPPIRVRHVLSRGEQPRVALWAGEEVEKALPGPSSLLLVVCFLTEAKTSLRGNVPALFNSMQGRKDALGILSRRVKSSSGPELFRNYYSLFQAHPS